MSTHVAESHAPTTVASRRATAGAAGGPGGGARAGVPRFLAGAVPAGTLQRTPACPTRRPAGEREQSATSAGILPDNAVFDASANKLYVQDFAVNSATLPPGVTDSPAWQRTMSIIAGTPSSHPFVGVFGYSDCLGSESTNRGLRGARAEAVYNALPAIARVKVLMHMGDFTSHYIAGNDTAVGRARNRAATVVIGPATGPQGQDLCDVLAVASDLDQYLFLVRCMERRLGLTGAGDAPRALSVLRQIYYGNASWTAAANRNPIWNDVVAQRPWSPGDDPAPRLGRTLFTALRDSQQVMNNGQAVDIGHLLTGLDAMRNPQTVDASVGGRLTLGTSVMNHAWATWAGDVGSAAGNHTLCVSLLNFASDYPAYFAAYASDSDLEGDIDSYANWAWLNHGSPRVALQLDRPLSEVLMQYYRLSDTTAGMGRAQRYEIFVDFYGGAVVSGRITRRAELERNLFQQASEFALLFFGQKALNAYRGQAPDGCIGTPPAPGSGQGRSVELGSLLGELMIAASAMTRLLVDWLDDRL